MGITAIIVTSAAIVSAANVVAVSLEWAADHGGLFWLLPAAAVLLMLAAGLQALRAVRTKRWRPLMSAIAITAALLAFLVFREQLYAAMLSILQPIGPGGLPPERMPD